MNISENLKPIFEIAINKFEENNSFKKLEITKKVNDISIPIIFLSIAILFGSCIGLSMAFLSIIPISVFLITGSFGLISYRIANHVSDNFFDDFKSYNEAKKIVNLLESLENETQTEVTDLKVKKNIKDAKRHIEDYLDSYEIVKDMKENSPLYRFRKFMGANDFLRISKFLNLSTKESKSFNEKLNLTMKIFT